MILMMWITMAFTMAMFAGSRGEYGVPYFLVSFALSPIAGWVIFQMRMEIVRQNRVYALESLLASGARPAGPIYVFV
jgi:TctA family transporter